MKQTLKLWMLAAILVISSLAAHAEEHGEWGTVGQECCDAPFL